MGTVPVVQAAERPHNVILFVPDGLRGVIVNDTTAPSMAALARQGVWMKNSHSLFPTFTTANASAMATGHYLGDTGDFSNTIYTGFQVPGAGNSMVPFLENDPVLGDVDEHFAGDYLDEATILKLARDKGFSTAAIGKLGPVLIFDHTKDGREQSIIIDDQTGTPKGVPLSAELSDRLKAAGVPLAAPTRGDNGKSGDFKTAGTHSANGNQQDYFASAATRAVLPLFAARDKPFVLVFWSRDPDGTQHNQGDSLLSLVPGINGPTSMAAIRNADDDLARLRATVAELGLTDTTDIIVSSDHGFSTISKQSETSFAAKQTFSDQPAGLLTVGFVAIDIAQALSLPLIDPDNNYVTLAAGQHPKFGNGLIGGDKDHPKVVVAANGGSDLIYVPDGDKDTARKVVEFLMSQDYVSGLFVDEKLGHFPGTLTLADINLQGTAVTPLPAIAVNFRSFDTVCGEPTRCAVELADTGLQQGQGMHGSFSRADTQNFMAAVGPDFKAGFIDLAPTSNADIGKTIAKILDLPVADKGKLVGRPITEVMAGGAPAPEVLSEILMSDPDSKGLRTVIDRQQVGDTLYFDAAGFPGRTVGLSSTPFDLKAK
ncbi:alkaline phosphatase family protein [Hyphomicrobiales bacterium BP6-180914]|uniref:Alkaline phosphatase family protein n=2 Tax=Lichenifustis flavocetrariae TaxID=2949735 RepID=A0AA41Z261_9HYPH|nr:alkaline phosphatase family protein [Lichenifustis flavocetrariae]MCW6507902.1 alkaline phosphatase family protein [Lichenifustis flavocetrariae]